MNITTDITMDWPLTQEFINQIIISAANELESHYANVPQGYRHSELRMQKIGFKPGFTMAFALVPRKFNTTSMDEISTFLKGTFSQTLFSVNCEAKADKGTLNLTFKDSNLPSFIRRLGPFNTNFSPKQSYWFRIYTYFMLGVFEGAIVHFGYKVVATITSNEQKGEFTLVYRTEKNNGDWGDAIQSIPSSSI